MRSQEGLFEPFEHRGIGYANRVAFSALTRARASSDGVPASLQAEYYRQRASAGLIITEAVAITPGGRGGAWTPGLYDDAQIDGWRLTTDAVHAEGGRIFAQLWHAGRLSHSSLSTVGAPPVSPSAQAATGDAFTEQGMVPYEVPRALATDEVLDLIGVYRQAAANALCAGFDGVEIHGAHGYLLDSFLRDAINNRTDQFGGPIANRARFLLDVISAAAEVFGSARIAVRISPNTRAGGMSDSDATATFSYLIDQLNALDIAWLDLVEGDNMVTRTPVDAMDTNVLARRFRGGVILNHGYSLEMARAAYQEGRADMIAFGRAFIANPDLVARLRLNAPLAVADRALFYGGGAHGLTDWPCLDQQDVAQRS